jgi:hypothetical protein
MRLFSPKPHGTGPPLQVAVVCDDARDEIVVAYLETGQVQITRFHRSDAANIGCQLPHAQLATAASLYTANTDRWRPTVAQSSSDEEVTAEVLRHLAARPRSLHAQNDHLATDWARTQDGGFTLTQVDAHAVSSAIQFCLECSGGVPSDAPGPPPSVRIETQMRALVRYCLSSQPGLPANRGCAVVLFGTHGYAIALYSNDTGFVYETEQSHNFQADHAAIASNAGMTLSNLLSPESLAEIGLPPVTSVIVAGRSEIAAEFQAYTQSYLPDVATNKLTDPLGVAIGPFEAIARGLLAEVSIVPRINLSDDLSSRLERLQDQRQAAHRFHYELRSRKACFALIAPVLCCLAVIGSSLVYLHRERAATDAKLVDERAEAIRLKRAQEFRDIAERRLNWLVAVNNQILAIKSQQPAAVDLLIDLDKRWPSSDPSWHITSLKATGNGLIEIQGTSDHEESVRAFATSLEFGGQFTGIQPDIKQVLPQGSQESPLVSPSEPHHYAFTIRGSYGPFTGLSVPARPVSEPRELLPTPPSPREGPEQAPPSSK